MPNQHFSLEKLTEFIGRQTILDEVPGWLGDGNFHLVFFSGEYGLGKTRLLNRIRDLAQEQKYPGTPTALIDLYHTRHHYPEGLARAIVDSFPDQQTYFEDFQRVRKELDDARAAGNSKQAAEKLQTMLEACIYGLERLSQEKGVLLLLDTVERWVYPQDARLAHASAWEWFKSWLGKLQQGTILLAGRPEIQRLAAGKIKKSVPVLKSLDKFQHHETEQYLSAVARHYYENAGVEFSFLDGEMQLLHTLSDGRPILLALYLDLYLLDPQIRDMLKQTQTAEFERILIERLISDQDIGEALKAAGRTAKGLDAALLAALMGVSQDTAAKKIKMLSKLSFVKIFSGDDRIFLHDEMYNLLQKIVYNINDVVDIAEAQQASEAIEDQYKLRIKQNDEKLQKLYENFVEEFEIQNTAGGNIVQAIRTIEEPRQALKVELVYYRLRQNIEWGLCFYYRYAHEAAASGNGEILTPLQIELYEFLRAIDLQPDNKDAQSWRPFIQGLLFIHPILQNISDGSAAAQELTDILEQIENIPAIADNQSRILRALLMTWYGTSPSLKGQIGEVKQIYGTALKLINVDGLSFDQLEWFKNVAESFAYRQRAYVRRLRGDLIDIAIEDFQSALKNSRAINFWLEESTARNDLGYAQTIKGEFQNARENIEDALSLRYRAAVGTRIAQSYSTLAQYHIAMQSYEEARKNAKYSVAISESLSFLRGQALGNLALAESTRRYGLSLFGSSSQRQFMKEALVSAEFAVDAFKKLGERERFINAKLEEACILRDTMLVENEGTQSEWFKKADKLFLEVADLAEKEDLVSPKLDALCNRIWLGLYAKDLDFAEKAAKKAEGALPEAYFLKNGQIEDESKAQKNPIVWVQFGKLHTGLGMIAFERWGTLPSKSEEEKDIKNKMMADVVKNMMFGLEYNALFGSSHHRRIRETRQKIRQIVKKLNPDELRIFCNALLKIEQAENTQPSSKLQQFLRDNAFWFAD